MAQDSMQQAKVLIDQRCDLEARHVLENVPGAKADEWRRKLDERIGVQPVNAIHEVSIPPAPMMSAPAPVYQPVRSYEPDDHSDNVTQALNLLFGLLSVAAFAILVFMAIVGVLNPRNLFNPINILAFIVVLGLAIIFRALKARL